MGAPAQSDGKLPWRRQHAPLLIGVCLGFILALCSQDFVAGFRGANWSAPSRALSSGASNVDVVHGTSGDGGSHGDDGSAGSPGPSPAPSKPHASAHEHAEGGERHPGEWESEHDPCEVRTERVIAGMTLGSVAFQMSLFYLVNQQDRDMRRYAFTSIGQTISIFCSVLTFNAVYEWIDQYMENLSPTKQSLVYPGLALCFFCFMELIVMFSATSRGGRPSTHASIAGAELHMTTAVLNAKTFGTAAAQMSGAAAIRGFGHMQFQAYNDFKSIPLLWAVIPFAAVVFAFVMKVMAVLRKCFAGTRLDSVHKKHWAEVAEECENEVFAFTVSFLCAVAARCSITESFPLLLLHGFAHAHYLEVASMTTIITLWLVAVGFAFGCLSVNIATYGCLGNAAEIDVNSMESKPIGRFVVLMTMTTGFAFSWCGGFGLHLYALQFGHGLQLRLGLALFTSIVSFFVMKLLDMLADLDCTGPSFDKGIVMLITALGVAIGLSWENAFHECVEVCVEFMVEDKSIIFQASDDPKVWAFALSSIIVLTVLPAYRMFIVPTMYRLLEEYEEMLAQQEIEDYEKQEAIARQYYGAAPTEKLTEQTYTFNPCPSQANDVYPTPMPLTAVDGVECNGR